MSLNALRSCWKIVLTWIWMELSKSVIRHSLLLFEIWMIACVCAQRLQYCLALELFVDRLLICAADCCPNLCTTSSNLIRCQRSLFQSKVKLSNFNDLIFFRNLLSSFNYGRKSDLASWTWTLCRQIGRYWLACDDYICSILHYDAQICQFPFVQSSWPSLSAKIVWCRGKQR